jgi:hypothetical protein
MTVSLAALVHVYGDTVFLEGPQKEAVDLEKLIFTATKDGTCVDNDSSGARKRTS